MENISLSNMLKKDSVITYAKVFIPGILFLVIMAWISFLIDFDFGLLSRDPIEYLNEKPYIGVISSTGIILWAATFSILLYSCKISLSQKKPKRQTLFLLFGGLLTGLMLIDDVFMIHDVIFPNYLNIDQKVFYAFYGFSTVAFFYFFHKIVLKSDYILFILSFFLLVESVVFDLALVLGFEIPYQYIFEDCSKFLGIIAWFAYFSRTSFMLINTVS
jgi:hypothetical protein